MQLTPILLLYRGHSHYAPNVAFARVGPQQHPEQLADIQGIRLRSPEASIHFDARRVHDHVRDPEGGQVPVQPEAVPPTMRAVPRMRPAPKSMIATAARARAASCCGIRPDHVGVRANIRNAPTASMAPARIITTPVAISMRATPRVTL
jgi:hypothetical protein